MDKIEQLGRNLGLDSKGIEYQPLENNYRNIDVTLILGEDYKDIIEKLK